MPTDPNDKRRTPGAAARRDMDGRANQPPKRKFLGISCAVILLAAAGSVFGAGWGVVEAIQVMSS